MTKSSLTTHKWLLSAASQQGYSHRRNEIPNQDYYAFSVVGPRNRETLVLAAADGAGSAPLSDIGSRLAANTAVTELANRLRKRPASAILGHLIQSELKRAVKISRNRIKLHAKKSKADFRDLATTLLVAVINERILATIHIGDGAIIVKNSAGEYRIASKPQSGEYANETYFITGPKYPIGIINIIHNPEIAAISLITDGLQPIAITGQSGEAHPGFFNPLFETLLRDAKPELTAGRFEDFISSERVWRKTMDDVTIVAAVRKAGA